MDSNISIQSQRHMKEKMSRKIEKKDKQQKNGNSKLSNDNNQQLLEGETSDIEETEDPTTIKHNTITSLAALKQMLNAYSDTTTNQQTFFQNYFQNHTNSLPSRSVINCRRLSQCREEDEEEDKKEHVQHVPSSDISTISGSDKSLSESSSTDSKTSVIDTVSGPTHKFVITKTKQPSEVATSNFTKNNRKYQQANTVNFPTEANKSRPSLYSIFGKSSLSSPHYDTKFFDSTLIEMKSQTSSSSTIDCDSTEDIWVKRVPDNKKELGSQPLPTLSSDETEQQDAPRQRSGTWGAKTERQKQEKDKTTKTKENKQTKQQQNDKKDKKNKDKNRNNGSESSRSSSLERRKSDEIQNPKKTGMLDAIRNRSSSDASKKKASAFMASMRSAMLHTGLMHNSRPKAARDGSAHPVKDGGSHTQYYHTIGSGYGTSNRSTMTKVMDIFRNRGHVNQTDDKTRKRAAQQAQVSSTYLRQRNLDPDRRRQSLGTIIPHRASDAFLDPNHAAILFRDSRGLPVVDPFLEKVNVSDLEMDDSKIFVKFFKFHKCYDLIPTSAKLVVFDTQLLVKKAFFALVYNGVRAAPLWDSNKQEFVGMLTITDFIKILQMHFKSAEVDIEELEDHKLDTWREVLNDSRPFINISPDASLYEAIKTLIQNRIHRLPVIEPDTGNVLYILTHKRILRFLFLYISELPKPSYMNKTLRELNVGTYDNIETANEETQIIMALTKFEDRRVSALPIVDNEGHLIDIYAKFDVINLAAEKTYNDLNVSIKKANEHRNEWFEGVHKCKLDETLFVVMDRIVRAEIHRLVVVDDDNKVIGILSLSDLLQYLVLRPATEDDDETSSVKLQDEQEIGSQISNASEDITETILEEEEQLELSPTKILDNNSELYDNDNITEMDNNDRIIDSPVLDKTSLTNDKPLFREVTVSGGE